MSRRFITVLGGDQITFTGEGFESDDLGFLKEGDSEISVKIDGITCDIDSQSDTEITCTSQHKPFGTGLDESVLQIYIGNKGFVATKGKFLFYVSKWSDDQTWGGFAPGEDDAVHVPKGLNLLFDIDASPLLQLVNVEGSLIFEDSIKPRTFDCFIILNKNGYIEIGTEDEPYMGDLTITMHGAPWSPKLPIFGNKVMAVLDGKIEMHGQPRSLPWHELGSTANVDDDFITLNQLPEGVSSLDWQEGEKIVIASTDFDGRHAETRTITFVKGL